MKKLHIINGREHEEAFSIIYNDRRKKPVVCVNIQKLWQDSNHSIDRFSNKFAKGYNHELVHYLIYQATGKENKNMRAEETVVRKLMSESFLKRVRKKYETG